MIIKIIHWLGVIACIVLIVACFMPWAHYADGQIDQHFTGFYSYHNDYGKPGKYLVGMGVLVLGCMLLQKIWAKRVNLFLCALMVGYTIKSYVLFGSCYNNYCPEKELGIYLMLGASIMMLIASIFPSMKLENKQG